ncbi:MAG: ferredoxin [Bacilli bacterium]|nr:ferredoxin [Bacilli bacterium]
MKVILKEEACIGCGQCCGTCPEVFQFSNEGSTAEVIPNVNYEEYKDQIMDAANSCPTGAIEVEEN